jgi:hypothetical protein
MAGADEALNDPENQQLLQEFTSRSGREITAWTEENVPARLKVIHDKFGKSARGFYGRFCFTAMRRRSPTEAYSAFCSRGERRSRPDRAR